MTQFTQANKDNYDTFKFFTNGTEMLLQLGAIVLMCFSCVPVGFVGLCVCACVLVLGTCESSKSR